MLGLTVQGCSQKHVFGFPFIYGWLWRDAKNYNITGIHLKNYGNNISTPVAAGKKLLPVMN